MRSRSMRPVSIIGIGVTPFGIRKESVGELAAQACLEAMADAGIAKEEVQAFYLGNFAAESFVNQNHLAPYVATTLGLKRIPCTRVEGACASSAAAFVQGIMGIASGAYDTVLVAGVEKMTSAETSRVTQILSCAGDWELEVSAGATFPSLFAMVATRHMHQYGTTREDLAAVAVKNHRHGALNPKAHLRKEITIEQALQGRPVAEPLGLFDCSLVSDGAAALLLCARERARERHEKPIDILGFGQASDWFAMDEKEDITRLDSTVSAAELAYSMAGLGPGDIQVAEVHDCFTIAEIVAIEDLGFMPKGEGGRAAREGITALGGSLPVNTSGGLKSKGHPVGATGAAQIAEVALQLRGEAGKRQVEGAEVGLAHNIGGSGATCVVTILKRGF